MPKIKSILVDHYPDRSRERDKEHVVAISFEESGKNNFTNVMWLTLEQAKQLLDLLKQLPFKN